MKVCAHKGIRRMDDCASHMIYEECKAGNSIYYMVI